MEALELVFLVLAAFGCALLGAYLGSINKRAWTGLFLGLFLGPIGLIIILLIPRKNLWIISWADILPMKQFLNMRDQSQF